MKYTCTATVILQDISKSLLQILWYAWTWFMYKSAELKAKNMQPIGLCSLLKGLAILVYIIKLYN